jgi:hypothetical protein
LISKKKGNIVLFSIFVTVPVCFCSCVSGASARDYRPFAWLTDSSKYILLPPAYIENSMDIFQLVSVSFMGQDYFLNAWVKADETGIDMTLINELGANMGEISYRDGAVSFSSPVFPQSVRAEYIIADFQFCFYSTAALARALKDCGLSFEDTGSVRRILRGKTVIVEIEKNQNAVRLVNHLRGYTYTIEGGSS